MTKPITISAETARALGRVGGVGALGGLAEPFSEKGSRKKCVRCETELEGKQRKYCWVCALDKKTEVIRPSTENQEAYHNAKKLLPTPDGEHCIICKSTFEKPDKRRKYCSHECWLKWYNNLGVIWWDSLAKKIKERDGNECLNCHRKENLEVHHIKWIKDGGEQFDENNCITLCRGCHRASHRLVVKKSSENWCREKLEELKHANLTSISRLSPPEPAPMTKRHEADREAARGTMNHLLDGAGSCSLREGKKSGGP